MKFLLSVLISFAVGVGCRYFDIPVGSPPVVPGAILVLAMTFGYSSTNTLLKRNQPALHSPLCGGPTGKSATESASTPGLSAKRVG